MSSVSIFELAMLIDVYGMTFDVLRPEMASHDTTDVFPASKFILVTAGDDNVVDLSRDVD